MKLASLWGQGMVLSSSLILSSPQAKAQVQTAFPSTTINANCNGFYVYTPQGYGSGNQKYPLLVFIHGIGTRTYGGIEFSGPVDLPEII